MGAGLAYIAQLYAVEKRARRSGIQGDDLRLLRQTASRPVTNQLHAYLLTINTQLLPKSEAGQAAAYMLKNWLALTRYLEDGDLSIDNNRTERSLRRPRYWPDKMHRLQPTFCFAGRAWDKWCARRHYSPGDSVGRSCCGQNC
jgi:hypothetical protein